MLSLSILLKWMVSVLNFSGAFKKAMAIRGLNAGIVARRMGYSPQYISDLLIGYRRWNETTITKACEVLGLKLTIVVLPTNDDRDRCDQLTGKQDDGITIMQGRWQI